LRAKAKPARSTPRKHRKDSRAHAPRTENIRSKEEAIFAHGVALFNGKKFFEAHEAWEEIWLHAKMPEKTFLQGLIQVTAAFHHHSRGNLHGMESLLHRGLAKLDEFPASHRGLRIGAVRASARKWLAWLKGNNSTRKPALPNLRGLR
jgi:predicted metal-dependent hydrolase